MKVFNKSELLTNKKLLKIISIVTLFASSLNAIDPKLTTELLSKSASIATVEQSSCNINSLPNSQSYQIKFLLGKLGNFIAIRPKTFIALSAVTLFSAIGFICCKPIRKKINEIRFINAYKINDVSSAIELSMNIDPNRATELIESIDIGVTFPFNWDCKKITVDMVELLITENICKYSCNRKIQLHFACCAGKLEIVKKLLKRKDVDVNLPGKFMLAPLNLACYLKNLEIVKELLKHKDINVNLALGAVDTPLHVACETGELEIVKELLKHKDINVNLVNENGDAPFHIACEKGKLEILKELPIHKDIINLANKDGNTPLHLACKTGRLEVTKELLKHEDINVNLTNKDGNTPLHLACYSGNLEITKELLKNKGINVNLGNKDGETPINLYCQGYSKEIAKELLKHKDFDVNLANENVDTPLHFACREGNLETTKELLKHKDINVNLANKDGNTPLHLACKKGHLKIAKELLKDKNINANKYDDEGNNPLCLATDGNYIKIIRVLFKLENTDFNIEGENKKDPLALACINRNPMIVKLLLKNGAVVNEAFIDRVWMKYVRSHHYHKIIGRDEKILQYLNLAKNFDSRKQSGSFFDVPKDEKNNKKLCNFKYNLLTSKRVKNKLNFPNPLNNERAMAKFGDCRITTLE